MAEALLVTREDIVKYTALNGNVDTDKFIQFVKIAQDTDLQNYTGTKLLKKIKADIIANTLTGNYLILTRDYLKPMLIHLSMKYYLPFAAYTISNKGVFKHNSENSTNVEKNEVDYLIEKQTAIEQHNTERFIDYVFTNNSLFPEYSSNTSGDMFPDTNNNYTSWFI
jgi:hypothetical protein